MTQPLVIAKVDIPDFTRQMREVGKQTRTKVVRAALRDAVNVFARRSRLEAPMLGKATKRRMPGALKAAIYASRGRSGRDRERFYVAVRTGKRNKLRGMTGDPFYWRFLEDGWIPRGPGRKLRGGVRSRALQRRRLLEGGAVKITKYRFFKPAFEAVGGSALNAFNARMTSGFQSVNKIK